MRPPARTTRSTNNPGVVDLAKPRRSSSEVAAEKEKKRETAVASTKKKQEQAARVTRLEREIRVAQKEKAQSSKQVGRAKRTFPRNDPVDDEVATEPDSAVAVPRAPRPTPKPKRKVSAVDVDDGDLDHAASKSRKMIKVARSVSADNKIATSTSLSADKRLCAGISKPRGLSNLGRGRPPLIDTVIEDFTYPDSSDVVPDSEVGSSPDEELEYLNEVGGESLVNIKTKNIPGGSKVSKTSRPGVGSLPQSIRRTFADEFIPAVIREMAHSHTPWKKLNVDTLQECVNHVYPGEDYVVEKGDALVVNANGRLSVFRNLIATTAVSSVQTFFEHKTPQYIEAYVKSGMIYYEEVPFLFRVFKPTNVTSKKEKGGYKVTRHGAFQNPAILNTLLVYYGKRGTKQPYAVPSPPGEYPIGLLSIVSAAVERALLMHSTGYFTQDEHSFSDDGWGPRTKVYLKLAKDLSEHHWDRLYKAMLSTEVTHEKLKRFSRPVENWTDNPNNYRIMPSDPPDGEELDEEELDEEELDEEEGEVEDEEPFDE